MALVKLEFKPGVNRDNTNYAGSGGWYACNKIRFRSGFPQKLGGWIKTTPTLFYGVCRQMWIWITSFSDNFLGLGTNSKLYIEAGGYYYDITPLRAVDPSMVSPNTDNCVQTNIGSATVTINLGAAHGADTGSFVTISGVTGNVGGIPDAEINTNHKITVVDADTFTFVVTTLATSSVASGGGTTIVVDYELAPGNAIATYGYGWGTGTWGRNAWGLGSDAPITFPQRDWWLDNFDNDFVANIRNGAPYWWERGALSDPQTALATRAITLQALATADGNDPNAVPVKVMQLLVSQNDKHLLAFGAVPFGSTAVADFDPLLIRWSDQDAPSQWTPDTDNTAGFIRVSRGSRIVRALPTRQEILVWTDSNLYSLQFLGTLDVFGLQEYQNNISIASTRACATASDVTYWMGQDKFYAYTGRVETLSCTLRDHVFDNINRAQAEQIVCGTNEEWNEIWWFYPSNSADFNDSYVVYNHLDAIWYYGTIDRTAWLDSPLKPGPQGANSDLTTETGYLYSHEEGVDEDTLPMEAYIQSNDVDLGDGDKFILSRRLIPDLDFAGSSTMTPEAVVTIRPRSFPGAAYSADVADSQPVVQTVVDQYTVQVFIRARARQMAFKIASSNLGVNWALGAPRLDVREDGAR